jgi:hypothetical protein
VPKQKQSGRVRTAKVLTGTALTVAGAGKPVVLAKSIKALFGAFQEARVDGLWQAMLKPNNDEDELRVRVESALAKRGDPVAYAFIAAARAAVDAVEPSVIASIGLLARRFILTQTPSRREYVAYLDLLQGLDAEEFRILCDVTKTLGPAREVVSTQLASEIGLVGGEARWTFTADGQELILAEGRGAKHVVDGLRRIVEARGLEQFGNSPKLPVDMVQILVEILPSAS